LLVQEGDDDDDADEERDMPVLSHTAAAGLRKLNMFYYGPREREFNMFYPRTILSIEAIRSCVQLEKLFVRGCYVDLSPLAGSVLQEMSLAGNDTPDLSPLGACADLKKLSLVYMGTDFSDLSLLQGCAAQLHDLNFRSNKLVSLEGIQACAQLQVLHISCITSSFTSLAPLSALPLLKKVTMFCSYNVDVEPLKACAQLEELCVGRGNPPGLAALKAALPRLKF
jgi:hypothetical protein